MIGDPIVSMNDPNFDIAQWSARHGPDSWKPVVDKVVEALKGQGITRFGTTGYCFGAPAAFYLAFKNETHVTTLSHPSRLAYPGDLEVHPLGCVLARSDFDHRLSRRNIKRSQTPRS